MSSVLVIDDDPLTLDCFRVLFPRGQVSVVTAASAAEGLRQFDQQRPDAVVLDVRLPDLSGLEVFQQLHQRDGKVPVILMTGYGTANTAIEAMRLGAYEYVVKPFDPAALRNIITKALEISRLMRVPARVSDASEDEDADLLVGSCPAMQDTYKAIGRVAPQDVTVLILGESGTGKELVARALYHHSQRAKGPFLAINCAAIPETLLESELFGHEKGAFTGADRKRIGKFEQCNGGTLFLDEIGDMTPLMQTKVLRVLQDGQFERVGGDQTIKTDVRLIAATNRNLEEMVAANQFRSDLYYRLNVYTIQLPPLRERLEDLPLLTAHFLKRFSRELRKDVKNIAAETLELLRTYAWPGNVRELQSVVKQALLQATGPVLAPGFLPATFGRPEDRISPLAAPKSGFPALAQFTQERIDAGSTTVYEEVQTATDRQLLLQVLQHTENNLSRAARILGISRVTLRGKLNNLDISIERSTSVEEDASEESMRY